MTRRARSENGTPRRNIFLIGFMASGKTKMGRLLAERLGWRFIDTDAEIERSARMKIADIFERHGEAGFRRLEVRAVARAAKGRRRVVSVGGGTVMDPRNVAVMRKAGVVLHRETPFEVVFERAERKVPVRQRPLWQGKSAAERKRAMAKLYRLRRPHYVGAAHLRLKTKGGTVEQAAERALARLVGGGWIKP
ncbi:MAG: shikimate kinase [Proteobacteria bacterium]|nr:shikimate kinase [Pseudomonadota bacterium]